MEHHVWWCCRKRAQWFCAPSHAPRTTAQFKITINRVQSDQDQSIQSTPAEWREFGRTTQQQFSLLRCGMCVRCGKRQDRPRRNAYTKYRLGIAEHRAISRSISKSQLSSDSDEVLQRRYEEMKSRRSNEYRSSKQQQPLTTFVAQSWKLSLSRSRSNAVKLRRGLFAAVTLTTLVREKRNC